jgi:sulfatase modifying factor 1
MNRPTTSLALVSALVLVAACGGAPPSADTPSDAPPAFAGTNAQKTIDLMAWDAISRAGLQRLMSEGVVAVRLAEKEGGVDLEVIPDCIGPSKYKFQAYSANESKVAKDANELSAALPLGSAALSGKVGQGRTLRTDFMLAGSYGLKVREGEIKRGALRGKGCERATHVVSTVFVGGFAMAVGETSDIQAGVSVFGMGASGSTSSARETLANEGDAEKCTAAQKKGQKEKLCSVPLRIALLALDQPPAELAPAGATASGGPSSAAPVSCDGDMVKLGPDKLMMGSTAERDEQPVHEEPLRAYCLDKTEVTVAAYSACVEAGKCAAPLFTKDECNYRKPGKERHAQNCLSLVEAEAYCKAQGKRLPTEPEWEFAARGREGRTFPWGEEADGARACSNRGKEGTCEVGSLAAGATKDGLVDLAGNVAEWTSSLYASGGYTATVRDYDNVVRGGGWRTRKVEDLRGAARRAASNKPEKADTDIGVRCAK